MHYCTEGLRHTPAQVLLTAKPVRLVNRCKYFKTRNLYMKCAAGAVLGVIGGPRPQVIGLPLTIAPLLQKWEILEPTLKHSFIHLLCSAGSGKYCA